MDAVIPTKEEDHPSAKDDAMEYTYDKAIEGYKQFAENTVKKLTSTSMSNLTSVSSSSKYDKDALPSPTKSGKIEDKLDFFVKEMDKDFTKQPSSNSTSVLMRGKSPKSDISKRKTMFEVGQSKSTFNLTNIGSSRLDKRRTVDMTASTGNLKNKVASFEHIDAEVGKQKHIVPPRDPKFKEKLANFSTSVDQTDSVHLHRNKKTPEKDKNFHQKLASFNSMESSTGGPARPSMEKKTSMPQLTTKLKSKIASFERLDQQSDQPIEFTMAGINDKTFRERSVSMECLTKQQNPSVVTSHRRYEVNDSSSLKPPRGDSTLGNKRNSVSLESLIVSGAQITPYIEVCLQGDEVSSVKRRGKGSGRSSGHVVEEAKRKTIYETFDACQIVRDVQSAPMFTIFKQDNDQNDEQVTITAFFFSLRVFSLERGVFH